VYTQKPLNIMSSSAKHNVVQNSPESYQIGPSYQKSSEISKKVRPDLGIAG
jgi:hypothetical protein